MPHFRVDDGLDSHPKSQRAGDDALGMWVRAGSWCMRYLTDGFVPDWWVKQQPKGTQKASKLVAAGLWHDGVERGDEKGYLFHEFVGPGRQDSREKIEADRELARKRKQKSRRESQQESHVESQRDTPRDGRRESRRSPGYTQPNPTQPISTSVEISHGGVTQVDARDQPPPPHCHRHPGGTNKPCHDCGTANDARKLWDAEQTRAHTERRRAFWAEARPADCCDPNGMTDTGHGLTRCPNHDWSQLE